MKRKLIFGRFMRVKHGTVEAHGNTLNAVGASMFGSITFDDGKRVGRTIVDDTLVGYVHPGFSGTFLFGKIGGKFMLLAVETADGRLRTARTSKLVGLAMGMLFYGIFGLLITALIAVLLGASGGSGMALVVAAPFALVTLFTLLRAVNALWYVGVIFAVRIAGRIDRPSSMATPVPA